MGLVAGRVYSVSQEALNPSTSEDVAAPAKPKFQGHSASELYICI